jgi:hypothetical protein
MAFILSPRPIRDALSDGSGIGLSWMAVSEDSAEEKAEACDNTMD